MKRDQIISELEGVVSDYLAAQGLMLVDLLYRHEGRDLFLRILADRQEGGITLGECSRLNAELGGILDEKNIVQGGYILEVSSPGLDRPLRTREDFLRCINRKVRFFLKEKVAGKIEWEAVINKVEDESVLVNAQGNDMSIPLSKVNFAKQTIE